MHGTVKFDGAETWFSAGNQLSGYYPPEVFDFDTESVTAILKDLNFVSQNKTFMEPEFISYRRETAYQTVALLMVNFGIGTTVREEGPYYVVQPKSAADTRQLVKLLRGHL
jgi:hypothetical protein